MSLCSFLDGCQLLFIQSDPLLEVSGLHDQPGLSPQEHLIPFEGLFTQVPAEHVGDIGGAAVNIGLQVAGLHKLITQLVSLSSQLHLEEESVLGFGTRTDVCAHVI